MKKPAFTLAEVLLTLSIIGIVAAMTIPSIISNVGKEEYISGFKKAYSGLSTARQLIIMDNGGSFEHAWSTYPEMLNVFGSKLNFTKTCLPNTMAGVCYHNGTTSWKNLYGANGWYNPTTSSRAITADGMLYTFMLSNTCTATQDGVPDSCGWIAVDVNGFKGPNIAGRDIFQFQITKDQLFPTGTKGDLTNLSVYCNPSNNVSTSGNSCGLKILQEGTMNY